jgi:hypothetical protein
MQAKFENAIILGKKNQNVIHKNRKKLFKIRPKQERKKTPN